jgi:glycosyltransferase involved in cell wall biosynthesis
MTIVHQPHDARILHRQIGALRRAGWQVTYAAPWNATGHSPPGGLRALDLPRAVGPRRLGAVLAARRMLRREAPQHDVVLLHDPELLLAVAGTRVRHVVFDVHEDTAAALVDRSWVPAWTRRTLGAAIHLVERWAEHRCATLLLAERSYAARFRRPHPLVLNLPVVPDEPSAPGDDRVVHLGRHAISRGALDLIALGELLAGEVVVELIGQADTDVVAALEAADEAGSVRWHGFIPNDQALELVRGAAAGLSLLHDEPNYKQSMPTKVVEYLAHGLPVITTPLAEAVALVADHDLGTVVDFGDVKAAAAAVRALIADPARRVEVGQRAHAYAAANLDWTHAGTAFCQIMRNAAAGDT